MFSIGLKAQTVVFVANRSQADIKVYYTNYKSEADLIIYFDKYISNIKPGIWVVEPPSLSKLRIYSTNYKSEADFIVFITKYKNEVKVNSKYLSICDNLISP